MEGINGSIALYLVVIMDSVGLVITLVSLPLTVIDLLGICTAVPAF